jgi:hypothetical protein
MTKEEETLLFKDLCARLPYPGLKVHVVGDWFYDEKAPYDTELGHIFFDLISGRNPNLVVKPYLRPMSSMTDEEKTKIASMSNFNSLTKSAEFVECSYPIVDYCCSRYLDYHGLIGMGLALEAPEDMYNFNEGE